MLLTFQRHDASPANLVATGLFGDGAAAVVALGARRAVAGPEIVATRSRMYPDTGHVMGWDVGSTGFRVVLDPAVPTSYAGISPTTYGSSSTSTASNRRTWRTGSATRAAPRCWRR